MGWQINPLKRPVFPQRSTGGAPAPARTRWINSREASAPDSTIRKRQGIMRIFRGVGGRAPRQPQNTMAAIDAARRIKVRVMLIVARWLCKPLEASGDSLPGG